MGYRPFGSLTSARGYRMGEVASAMQKAIRRGEADNAVYWAVELDRSGFGKYAWKRLRVITSEDVGPAWPEGPAVIDALYRTFLDLRKEEKDTPKSSKMVLVHAVLLLARAPKTRVCDILNIVHYGDDLNGREIPDYALDQHTSAGKRMGRGAEHFWTEGTQLDNHVPDPLELQYGGLAKAIRSRPKDKPKDDSQLAMKED
jgi:replication-associated recombination protein RarA